MATKWRKSVLAGAAEQRVWEFAQQLRLVADTSQPVPGLDWTVAELGQHVASLPGFWNAQHRAGAEFIPPEDFERFSAQARANIRETEGDELADRITTEFRSLLGATSNPALTRWIYGLEATASHLCGLVLSETVIHGRDLASVTGVEPPGFETHEAHAAVDTMMVTLARFVDPAKAARQPDGVYGISFDEGRDYTWTKSGSTLTVEPGRPSRADARMNADPEMFLLSAFGRVSRTHVALSGKIVTFGWRPWRFNGLGKIGIAGV